MVFHNINVFESLRKEQWVLLYYSKKKFLKLSFFQKNIILKSKAIFKKITPNCNNVITLMHKYLPFAKFTLL